MTSPTQLHLVNAEGVPLSPVIREAVETAFRWVLRDFPNIDEASLANMAESLALSMEERGSGISSPRRFAYPALRGRVLDSLRKRANQEQSVGIGFDLERIGGGTRSFQGPVDQKILFDQLGEALSRRDRDILVLLLNDKTTGEIAAELKTSQPAARKAIQRVKDRLATVLGGSRKRTDEGKQSAIDQRGVAIER